MTKKVIWPNLQLPPINLWSMPKMDYSWVEDYVKPTKIEKGAGVKFDTDKPRMDLLDPVALEGLAAVLTFGAKKYAAHNWRGGLSYSRLLAALLRHTFAILRGERIDPESGLPHIDHVGCCWMFASNMMKTRPDMDDLWRGEEPKANDENQEGGASQG